MTINMVANRGTNVDRTVTEVDDQKERMFDNEHKYK